MRSFPKVSCLNPDTGLVEVRTLTHEPFERFKVRTLNLMDALGRDTRYQFVPINSLVDAYWTPDGRLNLCLSDGIVFNDDAQMGVHCVDDRLADHLHERGDKHNPTGKRYY